MVANSSPHITNSGHMIWKVREQKLDLSSRGLIMGVLNLTPDSFSDGQEDLSVETTVKRAIQMVKDGADIIDIGGESTRPGATKVSLEEELQRTIPAVRALREVSDVLISIDTSKAEVARQAVAAGADIVNDVTGLAGCDQMATYCAEADIAVVVMHMQGNPQTMQLAPHYTSVVDEVKNYFTERLETLQHIGIKEERICLDPGIGFGKTLEHNKTLLKELESLRIASRPLLIGVSRKSLIGHILDENDPLERDWGTVALTAYGKMRGASVHRVHEVKKNVESLRMIEAILNVDKK